MISQATSPEIKVKTGQVWRLGKHRLMCGDATNKEDVAKLFAGERPTLVVTSPPYAKQRDYDRPIACWDSTMLGALDGHDFADDVQLLINLGLVHSNGELYDYWKHFVETMRAREWRFFAKYIWNKKTTVPGKCQGRLSINYEDILHLNRMPVCVNKWWPCSYSGQIKKSARGRKKNGELHKRKLGYSVATHRIPYGVIEIARVTWHQSFGHPAPMPLGLASFLIASWQKPGCITYDPFCGAGTTLLAAEQQSVTGLGMEISPAYCAMAIARWNKQPGVTPAYLVGSESLALKLTSPLQLTLSIQPEATHDKPAYLAQQ